ncbi:MAG: LptF/LptG family permease [Bacteroidetes bacterium]|nr:LptF/LptG family permease [Bacteroidota bacterium]
MKKLNLLILRAFIGPFLATFAISLFLFLIHFLWKYIDDLVGKGIDTFTLLRLIFYSMADLVPMALPLSVMISSLMTYGNLAESYELVAIRSAGVSLYRVLWPSFLVMLLFAGITFYFTNIVIPRANLEGKSLLYDLRQKKPAFNITEGVFYNQIEGYSLKVGKKEKDDETVRDIMVYEYRQGNSQLNIVKAEKGIMKLSPDKRFLYFTLFNGIRYEEMTDMRDYYRSYPHNITRFGKQQLTFDLSSLDMKITDKEAFRGDYRMMNIAELSVEVDSLEKQKKMKLQRSMDFFMTPYFHIVPDSVKPKEGLVRNANIIDNYPKAKQADIYRMALSTARGIKSIADNNKAELELLQAESVKYQAEWHKKFTLSVVIILLFLIAAPLGTIIRKGGIGLPLVIAVIMFIIYYAINIIGEKIGKEGIVPLWAGMWLSSFVLLPVGIYITLKASADSATMSLEAYQRFFSRLFQVSRFRNALGKKGQNPQAT